MSGNPSARRRSTTYLHRNRRVRIPDGHLAIGLITGAHGLRGELKVELHTDFPERFTPGLQVLLGEELSPATIAQVRPHQQQLLLVLDGVTSREDADELRGLWIFVPDDQAVELDEGDYFVHDIIGLTVITDDGRTLGKVTDVLFTGANEVYVVRGEEDKEILLPAIADVIQSVDVPGGRLVVTLLPGLLDE